MRVMDVREQGLISYIIHGPVSHCFDSRLLRLPCRRDVSRRCFAARVGTRHAVCGVCGLGRAPFSILADNGIRGRESRSRHRGPCSPGRGHVTAAGRSGGRVTETGDARDQRRSEPPTSSLPSCQTASTQTHPVDSRRRPTCRLYKNRPARASSFNRTTHNRITHEPRQNHVQTTVLGRTALD